MCLKVDVYLTPGAGGVNALDQDKFPTRYDLDHKAKKAKKVADRSDVAGATT